MLPDYEYWIFLLGDIVSSDGRNLKIEDMRKNLNMITEELSRTNLKHLARIRIFDILWWSYLKAERLKNEKGIDWNSIKL